MLLGTTVLKAVINAEYIIFTLVKLKYAVFFIVIQRSLVAVYFK
jgi:hypothetical protein